MKKYTSIKGTCTACGRPCTVMARDEGVMPEQPHFMALSDCCHADATDEQGSYITLDDVLTVNNIDYDDYDLIRR